MRSSSYRGHLNGRQFIEVIFKVAKLLKSFVWSSIYSGHMYGRQFIEGIGNIIKSLRAEVISSSH